MDVRGAVFLIVFLTVWTLLHAYLAWRLATVPAVARRVRLRWIVAAAALLAATFPLSRVFERSGPAAVASAFEWVGAHWLGVVIVTTGCVALVDLVTAFGLLFRRHAPRLRGYAFVAAAALSVFALVQGMRAPVVEDHEVRLAALPADADGLTVAVLADTHLGTIIGEDWLAARVDQINALAPDVVLLAGDIVEGHGPPDPEGRRAALLRRLAPPLGVWAVLGNHEGHVGDDSSRGFFAAAGARVLHDEWVTLRPGLVLAGVEDRRVHRTDTPTPDRIRAALAGHPPDAATILLVHRPEHAAVAAAAGADLFVAGHTHAGQIWPFSLFSRLQYPLFDGRYDVDGMAVVVSRGAGTWAPRMRLWKPGVIPRVVLRSAAAVNGAPR